MSLTDTIEAMVESGATPEMILAVVRRFEAIRERDAVARRAKDAERQSRKRHAESRGQSVTGRDSRGPSPHVGGRSAQVVIPLSSSFQSEDVVVGGVERASAEIPSPDDWPAGKATDHVRQVVEAVASPWLDPSKSPDLIKTSGRFVAWRKAGASWEHDVLAVIRGLCLNRRARVASWKFFDDAMARSISENRAALAIPEAGSLRQTGPPASAFMDRFEADRAEARRRVLNG